MALWILKVVRSTFYQQFKLSELTMTNLLWHLIAVILVASQYDVLVKWLKVHSDRVVAVVEHPIPVTSSTSLSALGNQPVYVVPPKMRITIKCRCHAQNLFDIPVQNISL